MQAVDFFLIFGFNKDMELVRALIKLIVQLSNLRTNMIAAFFGVPPWVITLISTITFVFPIVVWLLKHVCSSK